MKKIIQLSIFVFCFSTVIYGASKPEQRTFRISKNLTIFNSVFRDLDIHYVDTLNYDKMIKTSIDNMLEKLDPYTVYMPEEETDDLKFMTTGEYAGIGALISKSDRGVVISEPYEGKPAQRNGVRAGDIILQIDGKYVNGLTVSEVSALLKGTPNTTIKLRLDRPGGKAPIEISFLREKIQMNPVSYSAVVADKVGYVLLNEFTERAAIELKDAISDLVKQHQIESLVLDIRNNGGGLIDEAVKIVGYFVPKGTAVVTTKGKNKESERTYKTPTEPIFPQMKLVVLANRSSASASEILAGSLQDLDRAVIVGERTFGKGLVQNILPISYGGHLKVTTAKYYIPSGRCIQAIDYSHRNEDGSVGHIPDSLTSEFKTKNGRKVRDGGGIVPDTLTKDDRKVNIAYYIYSQNLYFEFATQYVLKHPHIASPAEFKLSDEDFKAFTDYLIEKKFTYTTQTEKYYKELINIAKIEGLDKRASDEFDALKAKLIPDISKSIEENREEVAELLSLEIIKRYYYQKGEIQYSLRTDKDLKVALGLLMPQGGYDKILK
ncbi:C-terminal processing peptidase-3 [Paludibacter propionicigenes WB4]|uniref:C-terminal processing peptidase-3 n=1 Tax=Paludibacter propionicigenes (strain DSM 17365 / JCM 13257 / WB4) TaxID=694427 RepID=E4T7D4_PALPW|nr:S41 family peptidase [Paludibacter propionicigenes]ADQ80628.1 C-terminal processing peptidase-3 [Paludibacter propionicigenes WB4]